jgi:hypothetical protein
MGDARSPHLSNRQILRLPTDIPVLLIRLSCHHRRPRYNQIERPFDHRRTRYDFRRMAPGMATASKAHKPISPRRIPSLAHSLFLNHAERNPRRRLASMVIIRHRSPASLCYHPSRSFTIPKEALRRPLRPLQQRQDPCTGPIRLRS